MEVGVGVGVGIRGFYRDNAMFLPKFSQPSRMVQTGNAAEYREYKYGDGESTTRLWITCHGIEAIVFYRCLHAWALYFYAPRVDLLVCAPYEYNQDPFQMHGCNNNLRRGGPWGSRDYLYVHQIHTYMHTFMHTCTC
jgi:hypothetical protein